MRYWFLPLIFAVCASAHGKHSEDKHGHDKHHPSNPAPPCANDEFRGDDGKCQKKPCLSGQIRNSSGVCICETGSTLINGQCVFPPCPNGLIRINTHCINPCPSGHILNNGQCVMQQCLPGQFRDSSGACVCEPGSTLINGECVWPPCPDGEVRINTHCIRICPAGQVLSKGQCVNQDCLPGQVRDSSGSCVCEPGSTFIDGKCVWPPCPDGEVRINTHCVPICPTGQVLSGGQCVCPPGTEKAPGGNYCQTKCQPCPSPCPNGQVLENNKCVCPHGQVMEGNKCACPPGTQNSTQTGLCEKIQKPIPVPTPPPKDGSCPSGVQTGKCYTFTLGNGYLFGYNSSTDSYIASSDQQFSKFRFCTEQVCSPTTTKDIPAGANFNLQEIVSPAPSTESQTGKLFVSNVHSRTYLTRSSDISQSGRFVITKWPGGRHCLGGDTVGLAYKSGSVGAATLPSDNQSCIIVTLTEVPCDIRASDANCISGNKTETTGSVSEGKGTLKVSMPPYN